MSYPASESDEVLDVCARVHQRSAGAGGRAAMVATGQATGVRRNKFHIVLRDLSKRDLGIPLDSPFSRQSA
jgi:hypothetical protein